MIAATILGGILLYICSMRAFFVVLGQYKHYSEDTKIGMSLVWPFVLIVWAMTYLFERGFEYFS